MNTVSLLGFLAGALTLTASLPQIIKTLKTKRTKDISLPMYIILNIATFLWLVYGLLSNQPPVSVINGIYLVLNLTILSLKIRYG